MSEKNTLRTRLVNKHDIEANWLKAENFTPLQGELIVYDVDENYSYERIKMGDGVTNVNELPFISPQADWNQNDENAPDYVKNRTHYDGYAEVSWGSSTGSENYLEVTSNYQGRKWYKVSSLTPSESELLAGTYNGSLISNSAIGIEYTRTESGYALMGRITSAYPNQTLAVALKAGYIPKNENVVFPEPGIYSRAFNKDYTLAWGGIVPIDEKYIPDTIARMQDLQSLPQYVSYIVDKQEVITYDGSTSSVYIDSQDKYYKVSYAVVKENSTYIATLSDGTTVPLTTEAYSSANRVGVKLFDGTRHVGYALWADSSVAGIFLSNTAPYVTELRYTVETIERAVVDAKYGVNMMSITDNSTKRFVLFADDDANVTLTDVATGETKLLGGVQSDWNETDETSLAFIKNKPVIPTDADVWETLINIGLYERLADESGNVLTDEANAILLI